MSKQKASLKDRKFNFVKSYVLEEKQMSADVQVKILIDKINQISDYFYKRTYQLLLAIMKIRQRVHKRYGLMDLSREKGMKLSRGQLGYILNYKFLTPQTLDLIDRGRLREQTVLSIVRKNAEFKKPELQNKVMNMYVNKRIKTTEISLTSTKLMSDLVVSNLQMIRADKTLIHFSKYLDVFKNILLQKKDAFSNYIALKRMQNQFKKLSVVINDILENGKSIKKRRTRDAINKGKTPFD